MLNAVVAVATLAVAVVWIGPSAIADRRLHMEMAISRPAPLIFQDALKVVSAASTVVLVLALHERLRRHAPGLVMYATGFGILSVCCLLANAGLSLYAITNAASLDSAAGRQFSQVIGLLGVAVIFFGGPWYLLVAWSGLRSGLLPRRLGRLGLGIGMLSLLPILGPLVLLLSIPWWLGLRHVFVAGAAYVPSR